jgi:phage tail-like protein
MAVERPGRPYSVFNFLVEIGDISTPESFQAGFQEVTGLGVEITLQEYRPGNHSSNAAIKVTGTHKFGDVTLKRGLMGYRDLDDWVGQVRAGSQGALHNVKIQLLNEERTAPVMTWRLINARPIKYTGPAFNGKGTDVAVEELVLAIEDVRFEGEA